MHQLNLLIQNTLRERFCAATMKKGNRKTNLYFRRVLSKTSTQDKTQRYIVQQLDIQNNKITFHNKYINNY